MPPDTAWGGDMAQVVSCFWAITFEQPFPWQQIDPTGSNLQTTQNLECSGSTAVWTMFGVNDDHFTSQSYGGEYGDECQIFGYKNIIVRE